LYYQYCVESIDIMEQKHPLPPFTEETAKQKIQLAEDAWNSKDPIKISMAYTVDSEWRNRSKFVNGRAQIQEFLKDKWHNELDYRLKKSYWAHGQNRIAVRFEYEYKNAHGEWFRAYGNENWEFDQNGLMAKRFASINDVRAQITLKQPLNLNCNQRTLGVVQYKHQSEV